MKVLALDTSTRFLCLGLEFEGKFKGYISDLKKHSEILIPVLKKLLKGIDLSEIDFFGIGIGPGSFTGLRIGIATIKGLCFGLEKRVVCIPSLDIIANNVSNTDSLICPIVDAKRNLVYSSFYRKKKGLKRVSKYLLISIEDLLKRISEPVILLGDGLLIYRNFLEKKLKERGEFLSEEFWYPKPDSLITLAKQRIKDKRFCQPERILPLYLYPKECQVRI